MPWENHLRTVLKSGKPTLGTRIHSSWPTIVELIGYTQCYDYVEFTAEYAPFDLYSLEHLGRTLNLHQLTGVIKVGQESREYQTVKALNSGFQGVNFADVRNPADAAACVRCVRAETPETGGLRGVEQGRDAKHVLEVGTPTWIDSTLKTVICVMIEKQEAVETVEEILNVDGVDMVVFGRSDYSMSIGRAGEKNHPAVVEAHRHVIEVAKKCGVLTRGEIDHPNDAEFYLNLGVRHFTIGLDIRILHNWWKDYGTRMREILATV